MQPLIEQKTHTLASFQTCSFFSVGVNCYSEKVISLKAAHTQADDVLIVWSKRRGTMSVIQWHTRLKRLQGARGKKPGGSGHAEADRRIQCGGVDPRGVLAEGAHDSVASKW